MDDNMTKTIELQLNAKSASDIKKGYPLILREAVINPELLKDEGSIVRLVTATGNSLRKGIMVSKIKGLAGY